MLFTLEATDTKCNAYYCVRPLDIQYKAGVKYVNTALQIPI